MESESEQQAKFSIGTKVQSRHDPGRVGVIEQIGQVYAGLQYYRVFWGGLAGSREVPETDLRELVESTSPRENLINGHFAKYQDFQRLITYHRLLRDHPLSNHIYAFNASRTRFYPYQFKPLMKFLDSPHHRVLICDEVGLGKTIEAGLLLTEFRARNDVQRVLVVCPSNLTYKWRMELKRRFSEDFRILAAKDVQNFLDDVEEYKDEVEINGIVSIETCRSRRILERLQSQLPRFDLVIVDEAHHMRNFGRLTRRAGVTLSECATAMIMLTATPVHLGNQNLYSLLNILDEEEFKDQATVDQLFTDNEPIIRAQNSLSHWPPDVSKALERLRPLQCSVSLSGSPQYDQVMHTLEQLSTMESDNGPEFRSKLVQAQKELAEVNLLGHIFTRTRKRDVQHNVAQRRAQAVEIPFSPVEQQFYDAVTALVQAESAEMGHESFIVQWRLHMPQRRVASCIPAMVEFYRESFEVGANDEPEDVGFRDIEEDIDSIQSVSLAEAQRRVVELVRRWPKDGPDAKLEELLKLIEREKLESGPCKILVFSFFKGTLKYLYTSLTDHGIRSLILSGDTPPDDRPRVMEQFQSDKEVEVLLCSRVGSEGLDFQYCHTMVNYDLPWNPMEVEQRIGRLDRIGQESPIIAICNFWVKGTIEERILRRLYDRIGIFRHSIGDIEAIIGDVVQRLERDLLSKELTREEQDRKAHEVSLMLERRIHDVEELEQDAAKFIGTDQYFLDEIEAITTRRRYVTGEQIRRFIEDFLRRSAPRSRLKFDVKTRIGTIYPDDELIGVLRKNCRAAEISRYAGPKANSEGIPITFDSEVAYENQNIEFVNVLSPLVASISAEYSQRRNELVNVHHVLLHTDTVPVGFYFYFVYLLKISAAKSENVLQCVLIDEHLKAVSEEAKLETALGEMVECGEDADSSIEIDPQTAAAAHEMAGDIFLRKLSNLRREFEANNDRFVERRLASIKSFYEKQIGKQEYLLEQAEQNQRQERLLRMYKGTINRLQGEKEHRLAEIELRRTVGEEYSEIAAGVLEVR